MPIRPTLAALGLGLVACSNSDPKPEEMEPDPVSPNRPNHVCDAVANDTAQTGEAIAQAGHADGMICTDDEDWFVVSMTGPLSLRLIPAGVNEDLVLEAQSPEGDMLGSQGGGVAVIHVTGPVNVRVYSAAPRTRITYRLTVGPADGVGDPSDPDDPIADPSDPTDPSDPSEPVDVPAECDTEGPNAMQSGAPTVVVPSSTTAQMCASDEDWFSVTSTDYMRVTIAFDNTVSDLDLSAVAEDGTVIDSSTSLDSQEVIEAQGPFSLHVYSYGIAEGSVVPYTLTTEAAEPPAPLDPALCDTAGDDNSIASAQTMPAPGTREGMICAADSDYVKFDATGHFTVTLSFVHAEGDLDLQLLDPSETILDESTGTEDTEIAEADGPFFIRVYGYGEATAAYTLTIE